LAKLPTAMQRAQAFSLFARSIAAEKIVRRELKKLNGDAVLQVPRDLEKRSASTSGGILRSGGTPPCSK
jgi:hypothetical protein